jgi:hypothetical protein
MHDDERFDDALLLPLDGPPPPPPTDQINNNHRPPSVYSISYAATILN